MRTTAGELVAGLRGNPSTGMCCCPAHDDDRPSLRVSEGPNGPLFFCHAGCPQDAVIAALKRRNLWNRGKTLGAPRLTTPRTTQRIALELLEAAERSDARPDEYLRGRRLSIIPSNLRVVAAGRVRQSTGFLLPAMVAPIERDGEVIGAHVTFLTRDGKQNARNGAGNLRRFYGRVAGGYVVLGRIRPDLPLIVGEGIESTLAAMQLVELPGVAALSASNLPKVNLPMCTEVIIAADADDAGIAGATRLADALAWAGRTARIALPHRGDWNDEVRRRI